MKKYLINNDRWETVKGRDVKPRTWVDYPCVYAFYLNEELVYIGHTNNFYFRFNLHRIHKEGNFWVTRWGKFVDFYIKIKYPVEYGKEAMIEKRLIDRLKPKYNIRICKRTKYISHIF